MITLAQDIDPGRHIALEPCHINRGQEILSHRRNEQSRKNGRDIDDGIDPRDIEALLVHHLGAVEQHLLRGLETLVQVGIDDGGVY